MGNLTNGVVFVQYLACRLGDKRASLLLCKECDQGADVVQQIVLHGDVGEEFLQQRREKYCIHSKAIEQFHPDNYFDLENLTFPFYFGRDLVDIEQLSSKPQKYAVLANGEYGLVTLPPRAKKVRCTNPHKMSRDCCHVEVLEHFESTRQDKSMNEENENSNNILNDFFDVDIDGFTEKERNKKSTSEKFKNVPEKLEWPLTQEVQKKFRTLARSGFLYSDLTELIPDYDKDLKCPHGHGFDSKDPKKSYYIQTRNVIIFNTEWNPSIQRTAYYRPSLGDCACFQTCQGKDYFLLNSRNTKIGSPVFLLTFNLLLSSTWLFSKSGTSLRGFLAAHNNRMISQYGAEQTELLPWHIFMSSIYLFWNEVLDLDLKKLFLCQNCGPKPEVLYMDGVKFIFIGLCQTFIQKVFNFKFSRLFRICCEAWSRKIIIIF